MTMTAVVQVTDERASDSELVGDWRAGDWGERLQEADRPDWVMEDRGHDDFQGSDWVSWMTSGSVL